MHRTARPFASTNRVGSISGQDTPHSTLQAKGYRSIYKVSGVGKDSVTKLRRSALRNPVADLRVSLLLPFYSKSTAMKRF